MVRDAIRSLDWYKQALGAVELYRYTMADGRVFHAQLKIAQSTVMLTDEATSATGRAPGPTRSPEALGGTTVLMELYVEDVDAAYQRAIGAGAKVICPLMDTFFGDRYCQVVDPFGHAWAFSTVREWLTPDQVAQRLGAMLAKK